jgi:hypothetical protein
MHAVCRVGPGCGDAALLDPTEPVVGGDFPLDIDHTRWHAAEAVVGQGARR